MSFRATLLVYTTLVLAACKVVPRFNKMAIDFSTMAISRYIEALHIWKPTPGMSWNGLHIHTQCYVVSHNHMYMKTGSTHASVGAGTFQGSHILSNIVFCFLCRTCLYNVVLCNGSCKWSPHLKGTKYLLHGLVSVDLHSCFQLFKFLCALKQLRLLITATLWCRRA